MVRQAQINRKTSETEVNVEINIDGSGKSNINTGVGFIDHMLTLFAKHGHFDLNITAKGDTDVDYHHTVEDIGIVLGQAIKQALDDKKSITRYGKSLVPMDEALALVVLDLSGRPYLVYDASFSAGKVGELDVELIEEFFKSLAFNSGMNLHIKLFYGSNNHHMIEAIFKAFGRALDEAVKLDPRLDGVMSTKGTLE